RAAARRARDPAPGRARDQRSARLTRSAVIGTAVRSTRQELPLPDAYVYDAVRTPRGRGRDTGRLHPVRPADLLLTGLETIRAGRAHPAAGVTLNRFCASGLEAVNHAAAMVASGFHDVVVAGGVESMSRVKMGADGGAIWDPRSQWAFGSVPQGISADLIATL